MAKKKLTEKEKRFPQEYIIDLDATKAAKRAGYSEKTAGVIGWQLLQKPHIQERVQKLMDKRAKRTEISADRVLQELARIALVDPRDIMGVDENGNMIFRATDDLSPDDAACIAEISQTVTEKGGSTKIKLHDKLGALDKIGRHLKLFTDVQEQKHTFTAMGRVLVGDPNAKDGTPKKALTFNVGKEPDTLEGKQE